MKTIKLWFVMPAVFLLAAIPGATQPYDLSWFTIAGGGGTSTGGVYSVSGTIGQADAGVMSGGNYSLIGGFWGVAVAIQTPGAPLLTITRAGANVLISWPSGATGFVLQENLSLGTTNWTTSALTPTNNGTTWSVTVAPPVGNKFYRLKQ